MNGQELPPLTTADGHRVYVERVDSVTIREGGDIETRCILVERQGDS